MIHGITVVGVLSLFTKPFNSVCQSSVQLYQVLFYSSLLDAITVNTVVAAYFWKMTDCKIVVRLPLNN